MKAIQKQNIPNIKIEDLPDGANVIYDGKTTVGVVMSIKYYSKLQALIKQVKELMGKKDK